MTKQVLADLIEAESSLQRGLSLVRAAAKQVQSEMPIDCDAGTIFCAAEDIQDGIDTLKPGDTLIVDPGVLYGTVRIADKPACVIKAKEPGTVWISGLWEAADKGDVRWTEKWSAWVAEHGDSHLASYNDDFLFRYGGDRPVDDLKAETLLGHKKPSHGYAYRKGEIFVRLPGDQDPNGKSIQMCDKPAQNIIRVTGSPGLTLDGFQVEGSGDADAILYDEASDTPTIKNCVFTHCRRAARLPHGALVEWSEYFYVGFWRYYQQLVDLNGEGTAALFDMCKKYWTGRSGALLEGGFAESIHDTGSKDCEFRYNFYHSTFDGFRMGAFVNADSYHNVYWRNLDNHVEFESHMKSRPTGGNHEHHSLFLESPAGPVSHQDSSGGMVGKHFVSHSIIANREVHAPFMIKLKDVKNDIVYAHCQIEIKAGHDENWGDMNALAAGMQGQDVPDKLKVFNCVITGDKVTALKGSPVIKGIARSRGTTEAVDMPKDWPIEPHPFIGPDIPNDLKDWPRPMRTTFDR